MIEAVEKNSAGDAPGEGEADGHAFFDAKEPAMPAEGFGEIGLHGLPLAHPQ